MNSVIVLAVAIIIAAVIIVFGYGYITANPQAFHDTHIPNTSISTTILTNATPSKSYLTEQQLQAIYGNGTYNESTVNQSTLTAHNLNLTSINSNSCSDVVSCTKSLDIQGYYDIFYQNTANSSQYFDIEEQIIETPKANIAFTKFVANAYNLSNKFQSQWALSSVGSLQYLTELNETPGIGGLIQNGNFLIEFFCAGTSRYCNQQNLNKTLQDIALSTSG